MSRPLFTRISRPPARRSRRVLIAFFAVTLWGAVTLSAPTPSPAGPRRPPPEDLTERIDRAIRKGRDALLPRLGPLVEDPRSDYPIGRIAFVLTALLEAGLPARSPVVARAFERLSTLKPAKTYGVACYLLVLGSLLDRLADERSAGGILAGAGNSEAGDGKGEERATWPPSEAEIHTRMEELATWLVKARTKRRGSWTYEVGAQTRKHDFSNTQFAVLGLHVAMEHGIAVSTEVFADMIRLFSESIQLEKSPFTLTYQPATSFEAVLGLEARPEERRTRVRPGGWAYRAPAGRAAAEPAYPAMTAAGASCVVVAVKALRRSRDTKWRRLTARGEKTLHRSYAWIEKRFDEFVADGRNLYYTLYSLEKVGDLGEITSFGRHDWYFDGSRRLLEKQRKRGDWGNYVDTSFALLFLTRATRSVEANAAPTLVTRGGGEPNGGNEIDLVYVDRAKGFLSARELLRYMAETDDPRLVQIGEEIVRNYDPRRREDLIPLLLRLWSKAGRLAVFARRALRDITGESLRTRSDVQRWYEEFLEIRSLEKLEEVDAPEVAERLRVVESPRLKVKLVEFARRRGLRSLTGELVDELARAARLRTTAAASYRRVVHGLLGLWTGGRIEAPPDDNPRAWERTAREWRKWWREKGDR